MQKFLFIFAHPDDETVGCGGTIKLLTDAGKQVKVISVTNGSAGEVMPEALENLKQYKNLGELRHSEFVNVCETLGAEAKILNFEDGQINNQIVWGTLLSTLIDEIEEYQPDVVVTFDHTGWYFHLDHVGVSIAATLAVQKVEPRPSLFFHVFYQPEGTDAKWHYVFPDRMPITHIVNIEHCRSLKLAAMEIHLSQDLNIPKNDLIKHEVCCENYKLVFSDQNGDKWLSEQAIFTRPKID